MWVGCVIELVSYFDTCQEDFSDLDSVQDIVGLFQMLLSYSTSIITSSQGLKLQLQALQDHINAQESIHSEDTQN